MGKRKARPNPWATTQGWSAHEREAAVRWLTGLVVEATGLRVRPNGRDHQAATAEPEGRQP